MQSPLHDFITDWLRAIAPPSVRTLELEAAVGRAACPLINARKRRRASEPVDNDETAPCKRRFPTPPITEPAEVRYESKAHQTTNTQFDSMLADDDAPEMDTPRAPRVQRSTMTSVGLDLGLRSNASSGTSPPKRSLSIASSSRNSSPSKQVRHAQFDINGFNRMPFPLLRNVLPQSLQKVVVGLKEIEHGQVRLPMEWMDKTAITTKLEIPESYFGPSSPYEKTFPSPGNLRETFSDFVESIATAAAACDELMEHESEWSDKVYSPLLRWICEQQDTSQPVHVASRCSTTSSIHEHFASTRKSSKMVDYCLVFKYANDDPLARRVKQACADRPGKTINHTDAGGLCRYPIGLSVEVKSPSADILQAFNQIGTWHAAQWRSLCYERGGSEPPPVISFLPGLLIQGHYWHFVATVPAATATSELHPPQPTLYATQAIGSTAEYSGICKIIAALRLLVDWLRETYWPAFEAQVLGRSRDERGI